MPEITFERARHNHKYFVVVQGEQFEEVMMWLAEKAGKRAGKLPKCTAIAVHSTREQSKIRMLLAGIAESFDLEEMFPSHTGTCEYANCRALVFTNTKRIDCPACDYSRLNWCGFRSLDYLRKEQTEDLEEVTKGVRHALLLSLPDFGL